MADCGPFERDVGIIKEGLLRMSPQLQQVPTARKRGGPSFVAEGGESDPGQCGRKSEEEEKGSSLGQRKRSRASNIQLCGRTTSGSGPTQKSTWSKC